MDFILIELYPPESFQRLSAFHLNHGWILSIYECMNSTNYDCNSLLSILAIQRERMNNDLFL